MRRSLLLFAFTFAPSGCGSMEAGSSCDRSKLIQLAADLEATSKQEQSNKVMPGLEEACGTKLPAIAYVYEENDASKPPKRSPTLEETWPMKQRACPEAEQVVPRVAEVPADIRGKTLYEGCDFARYGVLEESEVGKDIPGIATWAMHQWLLDQGLPPEHAKPITRALWMRELAVFSPPTELAGADLPDGAIATPGEVEEVAEMKPAGGPAGHTLALQPGPTEGDGREDNAPDLSHLKIDRGSPSIEGGLEQGAVEQVVDAHMDRLRACYAEGLGKDPVLAGRVTVHFVVAPTGRVMSSIVQQSSLKDRGVGNCMAKAFKRWRFPMPAGAERAIVSQPFELAAEIDRDTTR